jgi:ketosteroid isomerase-like protein
MDIERRIRRLEDRVEIGELIARYGLVMDDRDIDGMPALFTPDVVIRSDDGVLDVTGLEGAVKMFCGRFAVLGPSNHVTHDRIITFDEADPDHASGIVLSHAEMNRKGKAMVAAIRYHDAYRRHEGRWKFAARRLSFFYYVPAIEYSDALSAGLALRNRAYEHPSPADWPESLASWQKHHKK